MNENTKLLEEKVAYLERHVTEQDKAMLELAEELGALRREMKTLRKRVTDDVTGDEDNGASSDERPPHY